MNNLTVGLIAVIAVLGGFYGGFRYESGKVATAAAAAPAATPNPARNGGGNFPGGGGAGGAGGGFAGGRNAGTITNITATGFTLHGANGTDTKVTFAPNATVRKTVTGQVTDLQNSVTVTVTGTRDAAGNLTATAITIVPAPSASPGG